jgi:hypothetical protein
MTNLSVYKTEINDLEDPPRWLRNTLLFTKVGTKFRQQVAVVQLVYFDRG